MCGEGLVFLSQRYVHKADCTMAPKVIERDRNRVLKVRGEGRYFELSQAKISLQSFPEGH